MDKEARRVCLKVFESKVRCAVAIDRMGDYIVAHEGDSKFNDIMSSPCLIMVYEPGTLSPKSICQILEKGFTAWAMSACRKHVFHGIKTDENHFYVHEFKVVERRRN